MINTDELRKTGGDAASAADEIDRLRELVKWMAGCGYDFCQHDYFRSEMDDLVKRWGMQWIK